MRRAVATEGLRPGVLEASLDMYVEELDVTSAWGEPDPNWRYTDKAGHRHMWRKRRRKDDPWKTPSLVEVVDREAYYEQGWWCEDCREHHEGEWVPAVTHLECRRCGETVIPGRTHWRQFMPGRQHATATLRVERGKLVPVGSVVDLSDYFEQFRGKAVVTSVRDDGAEGVSALGLTITGRLESGPPDKPKRRRAGDKAT